MRIAITGANGSIGRKLLRKLSERPEVELVALVRSTRAAAEVEGEDLDVNVQIVSYQDADSLRSAVGTCDVVIHLVGIIRESAANSFFQAHEASCQALLDAELGASHIIVLGVVGSSIESTNACLRSRAVAEMILQDGPTPVTCIRVPMVLGEGDYASRSLRKNAGRKLVFTFRSASLEQPIDSNDVLSALLAAVNLLPENRTLELAGPECLSRKELITRAAGLFANSPVIVSVPVWFGYLMTGVLEKISSSPPVTKAMMGVLDHDDEVEPEAACRTLGISLTGLDVTLKRVLG